MSQPLETLLIDTPKIACTGDTDIPHPRVFLTVNIKGFVNCPYCGKHFVLKTDARGKTEH